MNIVITAGGTQERIDDVRYITNMATGSLGKIIYEKLKNFNIFYIYTKGAKHPIKNLYTPNLKLIEVSDTNSVKEAIEKVIFENKIDVFIHSMAISDYSVKSVFSIDDIFEVFQKQSVLDKSILLHNKKSILNALNEIKGVQKNTKISSNNEEMFISLQKTPKLVDSIKELDSDIFLISFKLLTHVSDKELIDVAHKQLLRTDSNLVIANDLSKIDGDNIHPAFFVNRNGSAKPVSSKECIAREISKVIENIRLSK